MKNDNFRSDADSNKKYSERERVWLLQDKYKGVESEAFYTDLRRLIKGEPLGYIIGSVPFLDCTIWLDSHPLIPRPETEYWTEKAIKAMCSTLNSSPRRDLVLKQEVQGLASDLTVLDLCAGSGAIGVAVAKAIPETRLTFAEIDPAHLPIIEKNFKYNIKQTNTTTVNCGSVGGLLEDKGGQNFLVNEKIKQKKPPLYTLIESDLFANISGQFAFILTNPPYIDSEANTIENSVAANEPPLALFGGLGGIEIIERIIKEARALLVPFTPAHPTGGQLWLEHEPSQVKAIHQLAKTYGYIIITHLDQYQIPRYSVLTMA